MKRFLPNYRGQCGTFEATSAGARRGSHATSETLGSYARLRSHVFPTCRVLPDVCLLLDSRFQLLAPELITEPRVTSSMLRRRRRSLRRETQSIDEPLNHLNSLRHSGLYLFAQADVTVFRL
jgi:hypothetical protein